MAAREENTDLTQCPVCFEPYTETGDYIPRILPCHCTLCQSCILKLIKNQQLECPQDRKEHPARQGEKSFPQNKYILSFLRKEFQPKETDYDVCPEHNQKLLLFCKNEKCQKVICPVCMSENHLTHLHLVVNVLEEEKRKLNAELKPLLATLNSYTQELQRAEIQVEKKYNNLQKKLTARKAETLAELKEKLSNSTDNMATLSDIREKIEKGSTYGDLVDKMEFVNVMKDLCAEAKQPVEVDFYELTKCKLKVEEETEEEGKEENACKKKKGPVYITHAKRVCEVNYTQEMEVLSDGSVVLGVLLDDNTFSMIRYDRVTGEVLYRRPLKDWAEGMVEVNLGGKPTLAVSYERSKGESLVQFYEVPSLYKHVMEFEDEDMEIRRMCRRSDSVIIVIGPDYSGKDTFVELNCAQRIPEYARSFSHNKNTEIRDMCFCTDSGGKKNLVIIFRSLCALFAVNFDDGKLKIAWSMDGALGTDEPIDCISVTCDQRRHLFVCDGNNHRIQCFSTDGVHLGCLVSNNEHGIGRPERVKYCRKTSSLLVVHSIPGEGRFLSELKIDYNQES